MLIKKLEQDGKAFYPATIALAVIDPNFPTDEDGKPKKLSEINDYFNVTLGNVNILLGTI